MADNFVFASNMAEVEGKFSTMVRAIFPKARVEFYHTPLIGEDFVNIEISSYGMNYGVTYRIDLLMLHGDRIARDMVYAMSAKLMNKSIEENNHD